MGAETIAVIGAGTTGRRIACAAALGGYKTILEDVSDSMVAKAMVWIRDSFDEAVRSGEVEAAARDGALSRLSTSFVVDEAIRDADLIIETAPEELEMKLELFTVFDKFAKPGAIVASNTSTFSIGEFTDVFIARERCIGMRFFDYVPKMQLVEIVRTARTSDETVAVCCEVARRMGKQAVVLTEAARK